MKDIMINQMGMVKMFTQAGRKQDAQDTLNNFGKIMVEMAEDKYMIEQKPNFEAFVKFAQAQIDLI